MNKRSYSLRRRAVAILATLAMVLSLFAATTATAFAAPPAAPPTFNGSGTQADPYQIASVADLTQLQTDVNGGNSYSGVYFMQIADIDLNGISWQTIGFGDPGTIGSMPFAGYYSGYDFNKSYFNTIYNLNIDTPKYATGIGLFGYVTGQLANITLSGGSVAYAGATTYVGAVVGYTNGSVVGCQSNVTVTVPASTNVGGLVGAIENQTGSTLTNQVLIQYSKATGNVQGQSRVGGIAGSVYCATEGNVAIDDCEYTGGIVSGTRSAQNVYAGGIVGYCQGWVSNSYAYGITLQSVNKGDYFGGVAGLLQGTAPMASLYNSYAYVQTWDGTDVNYDHCLAARLDDSYVLPLHSDLWVANSGYWQPETGVDPGGWGVWTGGTTYVGPLPSGLTPNIGVLNTNTVSPSPYIPAYTAGPNYPLLNWEVAATRANYTLPYAVAWTPGGIQSHPGGDDETQIFFDSNGPAGNGDYATPTNDWATALGLVSGSRNIIYFISAFDITSGNVLSIDSPNATLMRSGNKGDGGYLFEVSGSLSLQDVTIDGNVAAYGTNVSSSLIHVSSTGQLVTDTGTILQNNYASNGGAIRIDGGYVAIKDGSIDGNKADLNGGAIAVYANGTLAFGGGEITDNTAGQNGGGIAAYTGSTAEIFGAAVLSGNAAPNGSGGGVLAGSGGFVDIESGAVISGNSAANGGGAAALGTSGPTPNTNVGTLAMSGGTIGGSGNGNTSTSNGGGVYVNQYSSFTMSGGTISYNASQNAAGGGVGIYGYNAANTSIFTQTDGTISNNTAATMGGGVYIGDDGVYNLNGGTISSNTAQGTGFANYGGGGVYIGGLSPVFNMSGGTISGNTAVSGYGNGVYDYYTFNIAPTSGATFSIADTIYLRGTRVINVGATVANITGSLSIDVSAPEDGYVIADGTSGYTLGETTDLPKFTYVGSGSYILELNSDNQIVLTEDY